MSYFNSAGKINQINASLAESATNKIIAPKFGTVADNTTDNYIFLNNMFKSAVSNLIYDTNLSGNKFITTSIDIPNGVYRIKQPELFLNALATRAQNLVINGNGATFVFDTFAGNCFSFTDNFLNVDIHNLNFISVNDANAPSRTLFSSNSSGGTQSIRFHQCTFNGTLQYGINLTGSNCNSEWVFNQCGMFGTWNSFLYIGNTNTSDQFLNYWFNNCRYWCSSNWITAYQGGHFKLNHCDVSGYNPTVDTYLFNLLGGAHAMGVTTFIDDGTRYELKSPQAKVIYCEWDNARVSFENSDMGSNNFVSLARPNYFYFSNQSDGSGSSFTFTNCVLMGTFKLSSSNVSPRNNLYLKECWLLGDNTTTKITDLFTYALGSNAGEFIRVNLEKTKYNGNSFSMVLNNIGASFTQLGQRATLSQSPYQTLLSSWTYPIYQNTIVDDITIMTTYRGDGNTYTFAIKSDISTVSAKSGSTVTVNANPTNFYVGNRITLGTSNTIYTITSMDISGANKVLTLDKAIEAQVAVGDTISFALVDTSIVNMSTLKFVSAGVKYLLNSNMYLVSYGATFPGSGIGAKIIVKTIE